MILLAIIVGLFFNWKLIRMTGIIDNEMNYLWDLHVYIMIIIMIISLKYIPKYLNLMDTLLLLCILSFAISLIMNGVFISLEFAVKFILPTFIFFIAKYYGGHHKSDLLFSKVTLIVSYNILLFSYLDYASLNMNISIIDYENINKVMDGSGRLFNSMYNKIQHPLYGETLRPVGPALTFHASSALFASLAIYHLLEYKKRVYRPIYHILAFILYLNLIILIPVGQGVLVFSVLLFLLINSSKILFIKLISIPLSFSILYAGMAQSEHTFYSLFIELYKYGEVFKKLSFNVIANNLFFGDANPAGEIIQGEIYLIALISIIGIFGFSIFFILFYIFYKYYVSLKQIGYNYSSYVMVTIGLVIGSIHYNSTFMFPATLIIFASFGFISGKHDLLKKIYLLRSFDLNPRPLDM